MQIAKYSTSRGAEKYAADLSKVFPKREFKAASHPHDFAWTVAVYSDDKFLAYAGRRKGQIGRKVTGIPMRNMRDFDRL